MANPREDRTVLTATLVTTEDAVTEDLAARVDGGTDFLCVSTRPHRINVHLILVGHGLEELREAGTAAGQEHSAKGKVVVAHRGLM